VGTAFFASAEVLALIDALFDADVLELLKELSEAIFILCLAFTMYLLYQSERNEVTALRYSADTDALTKLHNQAFFRRAARRRVAHSKTHALPLALILIDIDDFKGYNDQFGHEAGNIVLRRVAEVLQQTVRADDLLARYGGEEFVILMISELTLAVAVAGRIRANIEAQCTPRHDASIYRQITASLGVAALDARLENLEALIEVADQEMYHAKRSGKNRVFAAESFS
jgi:diguanylate cyclase (GGDEF)-like protein